MRAVEIGRNDQRGASLIVALIMMLLISVIGITGLKSSIFSAKVATSLQADTDV